MEGDDYWNISLNKSFSFDDEVADDDVSEISIISTSEVAMSFDLIISDENLQIILEEQMLGDLVIPKVTLEEEVKILRRKLQETQFSPVSATINKLLTGRSCSLAIYKSLREKEDLLDSAVASGDGNTILQVIVFLKSTLKPSLFNRVLKAHSVAINHYVNYLIETQALSDAMDVLNSVGRHQEALLYRFRHTCQTDNIIVKLDQLKNIETGLNTCNPFLAQQTMNYANILQFQINERLRFQPHDVLHKSVIETLYYACEKFPKWSEPLSVTSSSNPFHMVDQYSIAESQFEWIALNERAKAQAWRDIEKLFEKKSVLKKKAFVIHIPLDLAILRLHYLRAPQAMLNSFLQHLDDHERRLALSKKVGAINSIVESLAAIKDRAALEEFKETLPSGTPEYFNAEKVIQNLSHNKSLLGLRKNSSTNNN